MPTDLPTRKRNKKPDPESGDSVVLAAFGFVCILAAGFLLIAAGVSGYLPTMDPGALGVLP